MATKTKTTNLVRVHYWAGTTRRTADVASYREAMRVVDRLHQNSYSPRYEEISTGLDLHDDGNGLRAEGSCAYVV